MGYLEKRKKEHRKRIFLGAFSVLMLLYFLLVFENTPDFWGDLLSDVRLQVSFLCLAAAVYCLFDARLFHALLFFLYFGLNVVFLISYLPPFQKNESHAASPFFQASVLYQSLEGLDAASYGGFQTRERPKSDLIVWTNAPVSFVPQAALLDVNYPYHHAFTAKDGKGRTLIYSRTPFEFKEENEWIHTIELSSLSVSAEGRKVLIVLFSIPEMWDQDAYGNNVSDIGKLSEFLSRRKEPLVLLATVDASPWSNPLLPLQKQASLIPKSGYALTYPSFLPWPLRLPYDQIYAPYGVTISNVGAEKMKETRHSALSFEAAFYAPPTEKKAEMEGGPAPAPSLDKYE